MLNIPNILTLLRILVIPFLVIVFYSSASWGHLAAALIFTFASITDWLDGYLARVLKLSTKFGAFLDPVADKLMVSIVLVLIVGEPQFQSLQFFSHIYTLPIAIMTIPAGIIVGREIIVSALREWMAEIGKHTSVRVSYIGKVKTTIQMIALIILLYCDKQTSSFIVLLGYAALYASALLTMWSMVVYIKAAWPALKE